MKNTKRKHLKLCLLLLFMVLGCFAITNVRTTTVQASSRTFQSNGRTYMEKHNDNTLNMEYIENDEELYDREPFTIEVGNTEDSRRGKTSKRSSTGTSDIPGVIFEHFLGM